MCHLLLSLNANHRKEHGHLHNFSLTFHFEILNLKHSTNGELTNQLIGQLTNRLMNQCIANSHEGLSLSTGMAMVKEMKQHTTISSNELAQFKVAVYEPFAEFLMAGQEEYQFSISLLDVVRFAGHACPSMVGAFLISQRAIQELFPETNTCIRGQVAIEIPTSSDQGATGPIANVFSMIFGAWEKVGFGGLQGKFVRRGLLKFSAEGVPQGVFRFHNLLTGAKVDISYHPSKADVKVDMIKPDTENLPFQKMWRMKITAILQAPEDYISVRPIPSE